MSQSKILIETKYGLLSLREISQISGIPNEIIRGRYYRGWRGDKLLEPYKHEPIIRTEYKGKMMTLYEIAETEGLPSQTVIQRYRRGERGESLGGNPRRKKAEGHIGEKYGSLTIVGIKNDGCRVIAVCRCDCGNTCERLLCSFTKGQTFNFSCGCQRGKPFVIHGLYKSREHKIWRGMHQRCYNPNDKRYPDYGGRGIGICERWKESFSNFYNDMGPSPGPEYSIDRINPDKGYSPENCRWATPLQQARNKRGKVVIPFNGESKTVGELAETLGVSYNKVYYAWKTYHDISRLIGK